MLITVKTSSQSMKGVHKMTQTVKRRSAVGTLLSQSNSSNKLLYNTI